MDAISQIDLSSIKFISESPSFNWMITSNLTSVIDTAQRLPGSSLGIILLYLPLGLIGIWRWGTWVFKKILAQFYHPDLREYKSSVAIITPVYNENPSIFIEALVSWAKNSPNEIIAVIDHTDLNSIKIFDNFKRVYPGARLIITTKPGKREALVDGIKVASSNIVALVDSDTIWSDNLINGVLPPFLDPMVGGVGTRQNILNPKTLAQKIFDIQLDDRYFNEMPFLVKAARAVTCLSGRTAFYRRELILPQLDNLLNETFWGQKVISGDDKRLTYLVQAAGYKCLYQANGIVFTHGMEGIREFLKQRIRWTRNSWRADLRALTKKWTYRYPLFVWYLLDRCIQPFTLLISPIFFIFSIISANWTLAIAILIWWHISRFVKLFPHFKRRPQDIVILPIFIVFNFLTSIIKIYALITLNTQGWVTRWDKSRLPRLHFLSKLTSYSATFIVISALVGVVFILKQPGFLNPLLISQEKPQTSLITIANAQGFQEPQGLGPATLDNQGRMLFTRYEIKPGDSLDKIALQYGISLSDLLYANIPILPNWNIVEPGYILNIPRSDYVSKFQQKYSYTKKSPDVLQVSFDQLSNTIQISGRGKKVTLKDIRNSVGSDKIQEVSPGVWVLRANIDLRNGVMLVLDKNEVSWLKMASGKNGFITMNTSNSILEIKNTKITSWDEKNNNYDQDIGDGRSYILAKDFSRMDINNSELAYLGFARTRPDQPSVYGVSWRMSPHNYQTSILSGEVLNSNFHHNYFGAYTFGATSILWRGNQFHDNIRYGLDPHDDSNYFLVENNRSYNNGSHGIIFSKRCINNTIRNNASYDNKLHGIMLHALSNNNLLENNIVYRNKDGISIFNSKNNIVRGNNLSSNKSGIRVYHESLGNLFESNQIKDSSFGFYIYGNSNSNIVKTNKILESSEAIYIKTNDNIISGNFMENNIVGLYLIDNASNNKLLSNYISSSKQYGIYSKTSSGRVNYISENTIINNSKNIYTSQ